MNKRIACLSLLIGCIPAIASADEVHMGVATCAASQCHGSAVPRQGSNVQQNEYVSWTSHDPHAAAYRTLLTAESAAIARRLGLGPAHEGGVCLDCHADNVPAAERGERFQLSDGVGCEACHGGAERWLDSHYNVSAVSHEDNLAAGLVKTEDPMVRAALCLDCHLGNEDQFATHRMMAAGHPRLSFELDTFTELWRTAGGLQHFVVDDDYRARKLTATHLEMWTRGVLADAERRLVLLARDAAADKLFPELGLFDCHACHRSMKQVRSLDRPRHGGAPPGQPFLTDGSLVMTLVLARAVAPQTAAPLQSGMAALRRADSREAKRAAATALAGRIDELNAGISAAALSRAQRSLLETVIGAGRDGEFADYASAEQAFMLVQLLAFEMGDAALQSRLDTLAAELEDDERYRPAAFARLLSTE